MYKFIFTISLILLSFISFGQKKKDLIKELAKLKAESTELQEKLHAFEKSKEIDLEDTIQKFSYAYGLVIGNTLKETGVDSISYNAFAIALEDAVNENGKLTIDTSEELIRTTIENAETLKNQARNQEGIRFLAENAKKEGIITTESGLQYKILKAGDGAKPSLSEKVKVHYTGMLINGETFDSSVERGEPATFGVSQVIKGWQEALVLMPIGSKWKVYIPQDLAYGTRDVGNGLIPAYSTLIFEMELLSIEENN